MFIDYSKLTNEQRKKLEDYRYKILEEMENFIKNQGQKINENISNNPYSNNIYSADDIYSITRTVVEACGIEKGNSTRSIKRG